MFEPSVGLGEVGDANADGGGLEGEMGVGGAVESGDLMVTFVDLAILKRGVESLVGPVEVTGVARGGRLIERKVGDVDTHGRSGRLVGAGSSAFDLSASSSVGE